MLRLRSWPLLWFYDLLLARSLVSFHVYSERYTGFHIVLFGIIRLCMSHGLMTLVIHLLQNADMHSPTRVCQKNWTRRGDNTSQTVS